MSGAGTTFLIVNSTNGSPGAIVSGPFGTGTLKFNSGTNQHMRPTGGDRVIANDVTMQFGFAMDNTPGETYNLTFSGPINMVDNDGRTISNGFSGQANAGGTLYVGDPASPNVVTLGNITNSSNQSLAFGAWTGPIVVNDTIVDPTTLTKAYTVNIGPNAQTYPVRFNAQSTYTGGTTMNNSSTMAVQLGVSTVGDFPSIASGPLGIGTLTTSGSAANPQALVPVDADRTLANAILLNGNLGAANASSGPTFNLNLTGPISLGSNNASLVNSMAGTLTLGKATLVDSTQPLTLSGTGSKTLTFSGVASATTVVNDVIVNGGSGAVPGLVGVSGSIVRFNNDNTYGDSMHPGITTNTTVSGTGTLLVDNTSGSGTGFGNVAVTGGTLGGTGTISQSVTVTGGAIAPGDPAVNNGAGTLNISGNVTFSNTGGLTVELGGTNAGTDYDQLLVAGDADVARRMAADSP